MKLAPATVAAALREAAQFLQSTSDTPRLDAELLMAHSLGVDRSRMLIGHMDAALPLGFDALIARRLAHEPIAYIVGWTEFFGRRFCVEPGVLIPRPDSETLIEVALEMCPSPKSVLDLGTGSGALLLTLLCERPDAVGVGIDASPVAIGITGKNAGLLKEAGELLPDTALTLQRANWHEEGWSDGFGAFDLIMCNPPYVEDAAPLYPDVRDYEPAEALFAGPEGLDDYRILIPQLRGLMREGAVAILEIGSKQAKAVATLSESSGFQVQMRQDLAKRPRALILS